MVLPSCGVSRHQNRKRKQANTSVSGAAAPSCYPAGKPPTPTAETVRARRQPRPLHAKLGQTPPPDLCPAPARPGQCLCFGRCASASPARRGFGTCLVWSLQPDQPDLATARNGHRRCQTRFYFTQNAAAAQVAPARRPAAAPTPAELRGNPASGAPAPCLAARNRTRPGHLYPGARWRGQMPTKRPSKACLSTHPTCRTRPRPLGKHRSQPQVAFSTGSTSLFKVLFDFMRPRHPCSCFRHRRLR